MQNSFLGISGESIKWDGTKILTLRKPQQESGHHKARYYNEYVLILNSYFYRSKFVKKKTFINCQIK